MQKQLWRNKWLICINELTSLGLQKNSWLNKSNTNPHLTFIEFMSSYFDDLDIEKDYNKVLTEGWVSKSEFETIRIWHELLDKYDSPNNDDQDHKAILLDKEWQLIVEKGRKAKIELSKLLNTEENNILNKEID